MKTDELITLLAKGTAPVPPNAPRRRVAAAIGWGAFSAAVVLIMALGVRHDVAQAVQLPMFWIKLVFPLSVAVATYHAVIRLAVPGRPIGHSPAALLLLLLLIGLLAMEALFSAQPAERRDLIFGDSWLYCLAGVSLLSLPAFAGMMWAMRGLAPTRLSVAGGSAGLLAGGIGAAIYALHCPELAAPFIAVWYVLGMAIPTIAGALLGPRLLRW